MCRYEGPAPENMHLVQNGEQLVAAISEASAADRAVVVDFFSPSCNGCRTLYPKLKQIAQNNPELTFIKVRDTLGQVTCMQFLLCLIAGV